MRRRGNFSHRQCSWPIIAAPRAGALAGRGGMTFVRQSAFRAKAFIGRRHTSGEEAAAPGARECRPAAPQASAPHCRLDDCLSRAWPAAILPRHTGDARLALYSFRPLPIPHAFCRKSYWLDLPFSSRLLGLPARLAAAEIAALPPRASAVTSQKQRRFSRLMIYRPTSREPRIDTASPDKDCTRSDAELPTADSLLARAKMLA